MLLTIAPVHVFHLLLLAQSLLLGLFLLARHALWPLAVFLLMLASHMAWNLWMEVGPGSAFDPTHAFAFAYGPLIWALVRHLSWRDQVALPWPHCLAFLLALPLPWLGQYLWPAVPTLYFLRPLAIASVALYLVCALRELRRFHQVLKATHSAYEQQSLTWLVQALYGLMAILLLDFVKMTVQPRWPWLATSLYALTIAAVFSLVCFLVWRGLQQPSIFAGLSQAELAMPSTLDELELANSSPLANQVPATAAASSTHENIAPLPDPEQAWQQKLEQHMQTTQAYLDPELSLENLARQLGIAPRKLSSLINRCFEKNFNDYVNGWRVQAAQRMLADVARAEDKLLAIQLDAGFASKSVFNAQFKRITGQTPSTYRQNCLKNPQIPDLGHDST